MPQSILLLLLNPIDRSRFHFHTQSVFGHLQVGCNRFLKEPALALRGVADDIVEYALFNLIELTLRNGSCCPVGSNGCDHFIIAELLTTLVGFERVTVGGEELDLPLMDEVEARAQRIIIVDHISFFEADLLHFLDNGPCSVYWKPHQILELGYAVAILVEEQDFFHGRRQLGDQILVIDSCEHLFVVVREEVTDLRVDARV